MYEIERLPQSIDIGYTGEMDFRTVQIDMSEWVAKMPEGQPTLMHIRPGEYDPYPVTITYENNIITWSVKDGDLGTSEGTGLLQVWFGVQDETEVMRQLGMSAVVPTIIHLSLAGEGRNSSTVQIPWLKEVMEMKNLILGYDYEAESWANGQRGGEDVGSDDPAYHNNAKYYKEQVEDMASDSEAYAAGTRGGEAVDEDDPAYHNNASYYNDQAALEKAAAQAAAETASAAYNVNLLAPNYTDLTFPVKKGQPCIYSGGYYEALVDIATTEEWTSAHWKNTKVGAEVNNLKSAIDDFDTAGVVPLPADGTKSSGGAYYVTENGVVTVTTPNGATTAQSFAGRFYNNSALPSGVIPGGIYKVAYNSTVYDVYGLIVFYGAGATALQSITVHEDTIITVPINAVGLLMRYCLNASKTISGSAVVSEFEFHPQLTMKSVGAELDQRTAAIVDCVNDIKSVDYPVGKLVRTRGFSTPGDYGGALYEIKAQGSDTVNNCTVFANNNGLIIKRVFDEPFIYLESLDVENVAWSTIEAIIEASGITDIRAYSIMLDHTITVSNFNFTFTVLRSSAPIALKIADASNRKIIGKNIIATYADEQIGLQIINDNSNVIGNYIDIRDISATRTCVLVSPLNKLTDGSAKGILENEYHFGKLRGVKFNSSSTGPAYGINIQIYGYKVDGEQILNEDGLPPYAYEGEDHFWVDIISCRNNAGNGTGVNIAIETATTNYVEGKEDYGTSVFGTVTGVTFHNLSVEECDVGVRMRCGERAPTASSRTESGIKSVCILNMRTREVLRYFDIIGWLRDIYIRPTSKIYLNTIGYRTALGDSVDGIEYDSETDTYKYPIINPSREAVVIDAYVSNGTVSGMSTYRRYQGIGHKLIAVNNIMFIAERTTDQVIVTTSHDYDNTHLPIVVEEDENNEYVARCFYENSYPCADMFYIMDDLSGSAVDAPNTVVLDLREYYYDTSAVGLKVSVPENCECFVRFAGSNRVKLGDSANERKTYTVSQYFKRPSTMTKTHYISVDG